MLKGKNEKKSKKNKTVLGRNGVAARRIDAPDEE